MDLLNLPVSITSWILLVDALKVHPCGVLYIKLIKDYFSMLPLYKVDEICTEAALHLSDSDFQVVVEVVWRCVFDYRNNTRRKL